MSTFVTNYYGIANINWQPMRFVLIEIVFSYELNENKQKRMSSIGTHKTHEKKTPVDRLQCDQAPTKYAIDFQFNL